MTVRPPRALEGRSRALGNWAGGPRCGPGGELKATADEVTWVQICAEDAPHRVLVRTLAVRGLSPSYEGMKGFIPQGPRNGFIPFVGSGVTAEGGLCLLA